jgi:hypothetical protein
MNQKYLNEDIIAASPENTFGDRDNNQTTGETNDEEPTGEESDGPGRPRHEPTSANRARVYDGARWGEPQTETAKFLNIDPKTLRKYYSEELKLGAIEANNTVMQSLFTMATKREKVAAAIFWAKTRCSLRPGGTPYDTAPGAPDPKSAAASKPGKRSSRESEEPHEPEPLRFHVYCNDGEPNAPY